MSEESADVACREAARFVASFAERCAGLSDVDQLRVWLHLAARCVKAFGAIHSKMEASEKVRKDNMPPYAQPYWGSGPK